MKAFLAHILYLVANPKAASSHVDAVYSRKCINFILRGIFGKMFGEKAQITACKQIAQIIAKEMNSIDFNPENAKEFNQETLFSQHLLVCALQEIGSLILSLGTTAHDLITDQSLSTNHVWCSMLEFNKINFRCDRCYYECPDSSLPSRSISGRLVPSMYLRSRAQPDFPSHR